MQLNMLEAMNIYVNVVAQGSFIRAAEVLELHRPAVTRAVQNPVASKRAGRRPAIIFPHATAERPPAP